jgi:hypothetical protein
VFKPSAVCLEIAEQTTLDILDQASFFSSFMKTILNLPRQQIPKSQSLYFGDCRGFTLSLL